MGVIKVTKMPATDWTYLRAGRLQTLVYPIYTKVTFLDNAFLVFLVAYLLIGCKDFSKVAPYFVNVETNLVGTGD